MPIEDENFIITGSTLRDINKQLNWNLPTDGAKTLNGLLKTRIFSKRSGVTLNIDNYEFEVLSIQDNMISSINQKKLKLKKKMYLIKTICFSLPLNKIKIFFHY